MYKFNAMSIKNSAGYIEDCNKLIQFMWKGKKAKLSKDIK
jgi:hypothetical protein